MICPHCNRDIPEGTRFCGFCGGDTSTISTSGQSVTSNTTTDNPFELNGASVAASAEAEQKAKKSAVINGVIAFLVSCIFVGINAPTIVEYTRLKREGWSVEANFKFTWWPIFILICSISAIVEGKKNKSKAAIVLGILAIVACAGVYLCLM